MKYNILISGPPASGKSTLIQEAIRNKETGGFVTSEVRRDGERFGFKIMDIKSGKEAIFASVEMKPALISKYGLDVAAFEKIAVPAIENAIKAADAVVIDEMSLCMETQSEKVRQMIELALDARKVVGTISFKSESPFVDKVKNRKDVKMHYLTPVNWERVLGEVRMEIR